MENVTDPPISERSRRWAATMEGYEGAADDVTVAHRDSSAAIDVSDGASHVPGFPRRTRRAARRRARRRCDAKPRRRATERARKSPTSSAPVSSATATASCTRAPFAAWPARPRSSSSPTTTCARASPTPSRSPRSRPASRAPWGSTSALTEAIALGHDCGHGPGGHASEEALDPFVDGGFDHAVWGADVSLVSLNLCLETLDGIRNHSWSRPAPVDARRRGRQLGRPHRLQLSRLRGRRLGRHRLADELPAIVRERCGVRRSQQLGTFINAMIRTIRSTGVIGMDARHSEALAAFRTFNYETIYLRGASRQQASSVVAMLRALVEYFAIHPGADPRRRRR